MVLNCPLFPMYFCKPADVQTSPSQAGPHLFVRCHPHSEGPSTRACASSSSIQASPPTSNGSTKPCTFVSCLVCLAKVSNAQAAKKGVPRRAHALSRPSSVRPGSPPSPSPSTHTHSPPCSPGPLVPVVFPYPSHLPIRLHSFLLLLALSLSLLFSSPFFLFTPLPFVSLHTDLTSSDKSQGVVDRPFVFDSRQRSRACKPIPRENPSSPNPSPRFMSGRR